MQVEIRKKYNEAFTEEKYQSYVQLIEKVQKGPLQFRIAETPIFLDKEFTQLLLEAGNAICHQLTEAGFAQLTEKAIPAYARTKNETRLPACLVIDFAIAYDQQQQIVPKLIELQGFPSLFAFELLQDEALRASFDIPANYTPFLNQYNRNNYIEHFKKILHGEQNKHAILLEIKPEQQKTKIDFYYTNALTGIPIVCITSIYPINDNLYYQLEGVEYKIERIYNRMVFEEILQEDQAILEQWNLLRNNEHIEWVTHPHHFFRFSKYSIPFLEGKFIPRTWFLDKVQELPKQLDRYIIKPLFSFAGQGVVIDLTEDIIKGIKEPSNWILQEKVDYAPVIDTPTGPTKAEIRLFYFWHEISKSYKATLNLSRLSKGKMIGVNYNKTATWVGGSLAYFES
jgi:hypothetical protein